jgi:hypothetical protein
MLPSGGGATGPLPRTREANKDPWAFTLDDDELGAGAGWSRPHAAAPAGAGKNAGPAGGTGSVGGAAPSAFPAAGAAAGGGGGTTAPSLGSPRSRVAAQLREADVLHCRVTELKELCRARALPVSGAPSGFTHSALARATRADALRHARARAGTKAVLIARLTGGQAPPPKPRPRPKAAHVPLFDDDDDDDDDDGQRDSDGGDDDDDFEAPSPARRCVAARVRQCAKQRVLANKERSD